MSLFERGNMRNLPRTRVDLLYFLHHCTKLLPKSLVLVNIYTTIFREYTNMNIIIFALVCGAYFCLLEYVFRATIFIILPSSQNPSSHYVM